MATVTVSYNGNSLPTQVKKLKYSRTEREATLSGVFVATPSTIQALIEALRIDDKVVVISGGAYAETFEVNTGNNTQCTSVRTQTNKLDDKAGGTSMSLLEVTFTMSLQTKWSDGFRSYDISYEQDEQDAYILTVSGEVTGQGTTQANSVYLAGITAIQNLGKGLLGDQANGDLDNTLFGEPREFLKIDRNNGDVIFTKTFKELIHPANYYDQSENDLGDREKRDATIIFATWGVKRIKTLRRGIDEEHLTKYQVSWSARLQKGKSSFISQYDGAIRGLIVKRIKSIFSESDTLVLEDDEIDYQRSGQTASGSWSVTSNGETVFFSETLQADVLVADSDKVLDEEDFTEAPYSAGARLTITQVVKHVTRGTPPPTPDAPMVHFGASPIGLYLKSLHPMEGNEIVGEALGVGNSAEEQKTGVAVEYTLNWRAVWQAYSLGKEDKYRREVTGGRKMNIQGKILSPI